MKANLIKLFLRLSIGFGFLSAVADRFGFWDAKNAAWGNFEQFLAYTQVLNPLLPPAMIPAVGWLSTVLELIFGVCLIIGFRTNFFAKWSGWLLLLFGLAMLFALGIKKPLDYSVFASSAGAFALSMLKNKFLELDSLLQNMHRK